MIDLFKSNIQFLLNEGGYLNATFNDTLLGELRACINSEKSMVSVPLIESLSKCGLSPSTLFTKHLENLSNQVGKIKMIVFDVDGVMTDAGMYYTQSGDEFKKFHARDGLGIKMLHERGYLTGVISHGINTDLIVRRCTLLGITHVYTGSENKLAIMQNWCQELGLSLEEVAFIGDDVNDMPLINAAGFTACPKDASAEIKEKVNLILHKSGGQGAIRELVDRCFNKSLKLKNED